MASPITRSMSFQAKSSTTCDVRDWKHSGWDDLYKKTLNKKNTLAIAIDARSHFQEMSPFQPFFMRKPTFSSHPFRPLNSCPSVEATYPTPPERHKGSLHESHETSLQPLLLSPPGWWYFSWWVFVEKMLVLFWQVFFLSNKNLPSKTFSWLPLQHSILEVEGVEKDQGSNQSGSVGLNLKTFSYSAV